MMSIFVPKTFGFSVERIKGLVERDLGKVRQVDIVKETCFIHLEKWYEGNAYPAIDRMEKGEAHKIKSYDHRTGSYATLLLLKNHSKKQCQYAKSFSEKDVLEQIEEGGEQNLKPLSLVHPDCFDESNQARWKPPSPSAVRRHQSRQNRTEGRSATDDQYIYKLEKEIASLRTQNHAYVNKINDLLNQDDRRDFECTVLWQKAASSSGEYKLETF